MIHMMIDGTISGKIAKEVFERMLTSADSPSAIVKSRGLAQVTDATAIEAAVDKILSENRKQAEEFLGGKKQVFGFLVGEVLKATGGKANPKLVNEILRKKLEWRS